MKTIKTLVSLLALGGLAGSLSAQSSGTHNMNALKNQAIASAQHCIQPYRMGNHRVEAVLTAVGDCINGNAVYCWDIWVVYDCHVPPPAVCDPLKPELAASVCSTCDGDFNVTCH